MNIRLIIEYEGSHFAGWQRQLDKPTVQQTLEDAIRRITRERNVLIAAGRTDSGAHARGQVCNFYTDYSVSADRWTRILNYFIPNSIRVLESSRVSDGFHSQKDALSKVYEYRILNRRVASALDSRVLFYPRVLDWERIRQGCPLFVGQHDFRSFQGAQASVRSTLRQIERLELDDSQNKSGLYRFEIEGNGFLKQMVRNIVGTLLDVGEHRTQVADIHRIIAGADRRLAGATAPAGGLCLLRVNYGCEVASSANACVSQHGSLSFSENTLPVASSAVFS